jgi:predicted site-specific integrase-resolvase
MAKPSPDPLLTLNHAARQLNLAPGTLRTHADTGRIPCEKLSDGSRVFKASVIDKEVERRQFKRSRDE